MMKKSNLILAFVLGSFSPLISQTLSIGPIVGVNASQFGNSSESKTLFGFSAGALANYSVNEHVGLSAKLLYLQLGAKSTMSNTAYTRFHYLQMPISLVFYLGDAGNKFRPKIFGGPYVATLLRANNEAKNKMIDGAGADVFKTHDIGGQVGVGFNYLVKSRTWLNVDLAYGHSFTDISASDLNKMYNSSLSLSVGLSFPIGSN